MRRSICVLLTAACSSAAPPLNDDTARARAPEVVVDAAPVGDVDPYLGGRWIAGDLHEHVTPADRGDKVTFDPHRVAEEAKAKGMEFVVLTPHLWPETWATPRARKAFLADWARMMRLAAAETGITMIGGVEYSVPDLGHFGVSGVDLPTLAGADFLEAAVTAGAFVVVNHPFALPLKVWGVKASEWDMSYRPWTRQGTAAQPAFAGVEVWNVPLSLADFVAGRRKDTAEQRAYAAAARTARDERRPIALVGGSDNHRIAPVPTTWVFAADASAAAVLAALHAGRVCVGGPEAGTLRARGAGPWVGIGGTVSAAKIVELRFDGSAEVFVDGVSVGEHEGAYTHDAASGVHTYRIAVGRSRSGFVYANL